MSVERFATMRAPLGDLTPPTGPAAAVTCSGWSQRSMLGTDNSCSTIRSTMPFRSYSSDPLLDPFCQLDPSSHMARAADSNIPRVAAATTVDPIPSRSKEAHPNIRFAEIILARQGKNTSDGAEVSTPICRLPIASTRKPKASSSGRESFTDSSLHMMLNESQARSVGRLESEILTSITDGFEHWNAADRRTCQPVLHARVGIRADGRPVSRYPKSAAVVLRLLPLAAAATRGETVTAVIQVDGPSTARAAVAANARLLTNVIHRDHLLANQSNTAHRQGAPTRTVTRRRFDGTTGSESPRGTRFRPGICRATDVERSHRWLNDVVFIDELDSRNVWCEFEAP